MTEKLTDWFPPSIKPVRVGVYQREHRGRAKWARWDGKSWNLTLIDRARAEIASIRTTHANLPWRGLAEQPWIEWAGGECPVAESVEIEFQLRHIEDGEVSSTKVPKAYRWEHVNSLDDIVRYRVIEKAQP